MLKSSFQDDTLKIDSIVIPLFADTINPDTSAIEAKIDSIVSSKKKDSISPVTEKKISVKVKQADSLVSQNIPVLTKDTFIFSTTDSLNKDTFLLIQQQKKDTFTTSFLSEKTDENILPIKLREDQHSGWVLFLFLFIFSLLAWTKVAYTKRVKQLFEAFLSNRYIRQMVREEFVFSHPTSIALSIVFLLTSSLLLTQANDYFQWNVFEGSAVGIFLKILFSLTTFYIAKILLIRTSAVLFSAGEEITEYLFNLFLFNNILGLLLLPFTMGVIFTRAVSPQKIIICSAALVLIAFLFRLVKCVYIGIVATKISKSYIILYICALEILPVFVVIKAFIGNN